MSAIWPVITLVVCAGAVFAARRDITWVSTVAWLLLAGGFAFLMWGESNLAAAVSIAAIAGLAVAPAMNDSGARLRSAAFGAIVPATVAVGAMICVRDASSIWGGNVVLFTAAWGALVAALSCIMSAMAVSKRPLSTSVPATIAATAVAILIAGTGRSSLPDAFYGFGLRTGEEPLQWILGPTTGFESGIRLSVAVPVAELEAALIAIAIIGFVAVGALLLGKRKVVVGALGVAGLAALGIVSSLSLLVSGLKMPAAEPYADEIKRRLLARGGNQVTDTGAFTTAGDITVAMADLAPEVLGLSLIGLLAIFGALASREENPEEQAGDRALARAFTVRGVAFLWVAWFVLLIIHNDLLGAPGMGSPGEWVFTGVCICATGIVMMGWQAPTTKLGEKTDELGPGLIAAGIILCAGLAWRFGALPGLSLGIFG